MLGIGRIFVAPDGANLISLSQRESDGATFRGNDKELIINNKSWKEMFKAKSRKTHVMDGESFREACSTISDNMKAFFSDFEDGTGSRQRYVLTWNGLIKDTHYDPEHRLVKRTHFNADVLTRAKAARELHKQMGHPSDDALGNTLNHGAYRDLNITPRDLLAANDCYGACLEGKMIADPQRRSKKKPVRHMGEYVSVDLLPAKTPNLGGNAFLLVSRDRLSSYFMCVPMKNKETGSVLAGLLCIRNFYRSHNHDVHKFIFDNEAVFQSVKENVD
jgi:hypothetical protein